MSPRKIFLWLALLSCLTLALPVPAQTGSTASSSDSLRRYADALDFGVGSAIQRRYWSDPRYKDVLAKEFNRSVSIVFMNTTQPERGQFNFQPMDGDMKFAREHNLKLFGHVLVYRNDQTPEWVGFGRNCAGPSARDLDRILKEHIQTVIRHGGDAYYAWEIVNEPSTGPAHNGCWAKIMGQVEMITKAFQYAREAAPNAQLVINDTFGQEGLDRDSVDRFFDLVNRAKANGAPIDVVGTEMHLEAHRLRPSYIDEFKYFLDKARKAGVKVEITEMDVYQGPPGAFQDSAAKQKEVFYNVAKTCLKDSNCISLYVWGLNDEFTWLRPAKHLDDATPLLFDGQYRRKAAYDGVLQALKEGR
jgi:endo-1,4-beta-xylanase